jgi:putative intracellular protease/amidase
MTTPPITTPPITIGALMYTGFEMLDMFGPLEMFSLLGPERVELRMVAESTDPVATAVSDALSAGPRVAADCSFADAPQFDILLVPGGFGTLPQLENPQLLAFLRQQAAGARQMGLLD